MNGLNKDECYHSSSDKELECRVNELIGSYAGLAEASNVSGISISQLKRYKKNPASMSFAPIAKLASAKNISLDWIWKGENEPQPAHHQAKEMGGSYGVDGFSLIPLYDVSASAGQGATIEQERVSSQIAFRQEWLNQEGLSAKGLAAITAKGDSMEPTIADGALLLVDSSQRRISNDSIYILRWDGHLYAKRLQLMFSGAVCIISDNKIYKEETISPDEATGLDIVGRVVWVGQKI